MHDLVRPHCLTTSPGETFNKIQFSKFVNEFDWSVSNLSGILSMIWTIFLSSLKLDALVLIFFSYKK